MDNDVKVDHISFGPNGAQAFGNVATRLLRSGGNIHMGRTWVGDDGFSYMNVPRKKQGVHVPELVTNAKGEPVLDDKGKPQYKLPHDCVRTLNNNATLRRDAWLRIDDSMIEAPTLALRVIDDFTRAGLSESIDGMATPVLGYDMIGRITGAKVSMNPLRKAESDIPDLTSAYLPIPIIHKNVMLEGRFNAIDVANGGHIKTAMFKDAGIRVLELAEQMAMGTYASYAFQTPLGTASVYGLINHPSRIVGSMTAPTTSGWTPETTVNELIDAKFQLSESFRRGPYFVYVSPSWADKFFDKDYTPAYSGETLRTRLAKVEGLGQIRVSEWLTGYQMVIVQAASTTMDIVVGMGSTKPKTMQWEEQGGMALYFTVMTILVPRIKTDIDGNMGIWHAIAA